jgi:hypothetical protein
VRNYRRSSVASFLLYRLQEDRPWAFSEADGRMISWNVETITRFSTAIVGCAATPVLAGLAYARWTNGIRKDLPRWRNGLGLASMIIIFTLWLLQSSRWILNRDLTSYGTDSVWMEIERLVPAYYVLAALPLAYALKRAPRILMIAAWAMVQLYYGAFIYT